ncbi:LLM class flavin-dependent oxidoreductase [Streptosporangium sp. NBC_01755]|uniref:LLM class flavin-dependent oxidoreductase n=1 Tax=unclassified Streptosporangium TaxID=2632669 RepID=UPI002DDB88E3|nr:MULTISPECIES: LLM class flavin-dependent oxidoreductase [unclassified Streptosporangium]WSA28324.1 LLM class flavin-dependent oxidoreductase [Streptosporangium sp. NBC_01810]WSD00198.1 LLM class flavin-dependent oxidoreductase [Streptosporangium sp. NBC_01755]
MAEDTICGTARGSSEVPLSILELAVVGSGVTPTETLEASTELARRAEEWGYHRIWVAEHHGMPSVASSSPAVLIAHLAAATRSIRLGSGGVMLPNHAPLIVAEQFGTLHALHPGRIDLGLGRAPGTDPATARALRRNGPDADDFPEQLAELTAFLDGSFPQGHSLERVVAVPRSPESGRPPIWLLGSSGFSAQLAGMLGLPFAFAHHFSGNNTIPALELYRSAFRPSAVLGRPYAMIGVSAVAADTSEQALRLARPGALSMLRLRRGAPQPVPTPEEAEAYPYSPIEKDFLDDHLSKVVIGDPVEVRQGLEDLRKRTEADELMITTMVHSPADRIRSYELIAQAYGLI